MKKLSLLLLCILAITSCTSITHISIDYMIPAEINFPESLRRVAIVNNASDQVAENKSFEEQIKLSETSPKLFNFDGDASIMVESFAQSLATANYFDEVVVCDSALRANDRFNREALLSQSETKELVEQLDVDFIISVDNLPLQASRYIDYHPEWNTFVGLVDMKVNPTVTIYIPSRSNPLYVINAKDSIYWEKFGKTEGYVIANQIKENEMIKEASTFAGTLPMKYLLPSWKTVNRTVYVGGNIHMRDAMIYARENNWEQALEIWSNAYNHTKKKKEKMRLANNIALCYEVLDDLENGIEWAEKAQKLAYEIDKIEDRELKTTSIYDIANYVNATRYLEDLKKRKQDLPILNVQMKRIHEVF